MKRGWAISGRIKQRADFRRSVAATRKPDVAAGFLGRKERDRRGSRKELISCRKRSLYFSLLARQQWRAAHQCQWSGFSQAPASLRVSQADGTGRICGFPVVCAARSKEHASGYALERVMAAWEQSGMILKNRGRNYVACTFSVTRRINVAVRTPAYDGSGLLPLPCLPAAGSSAFPLFPWNRRFQMSQ